MAASNKYSIQLTQDGTQWTAAIMRRVSRKQLLASKSQSGFASEADAQAWADNELKGFMENQNLRNQRRDKKRVP